VIFLKICDAAVNHHITYDFNDETTA